MLIHSDMKTNQEVNKHGTFLLPYDIYRTCIPQFFTCFPMHWHEELEIVLYDFKEECYLDLSLDKVNSNENFICFNINDIGETE